MLKAGGIDAEPELHPAVQAAIFVIEETSVQDPLEHGELLRVPVAERQERSGEIPQRDELLRETHHPITERGALVGLHEEGDDALERRALLCSSAACVERRGDRQLGDRLQIGVLRRAVASRRIELGQVPNNPVEGAVDVALGCEALRDHG